jgi:hypothetical protein
VTGTHLSRSSIPRRTCNNSTLLFPTADPIPNTQWYKVKHSILPPIDLLLLLWLPKDVQILHCHSNFPSQSLFPLRRQTLLPKFQCYFFYKVLASTIVTQTRKAVASRSNKKGISLLVAFRFQQIWGTLRGTMLGKCKKRTLQKVLSVTVTPVLFIEIWIFGVNKTTNVKNGDWKSVFSQNRSQDTERRNQITKKVWKKDMIKYSKNSMTKTLSQWT